MIFGLFKGIILLILIILFALLLFVVYFPKNQQYFDICAKSLFLDNDIKKKYSNISGEK